MFYRFGLLGVIQPKEKLDFCYRKINHFRQKRFLCCERILSKDILLILLSFATSETRWSDCLTNIWPFITMKVCPIECKICQKSSKCCQIQNELFQRSFLSLPSVEISPNLVTLLATFAWIRHRDWSKESWNIETTASANQAWYLVKNSFYFPQRASAFYVKTLPKSGLGLRGTGRSADWAANLTLWPWIPLRSSYIVVCEILFGGNRCRYWSVHFCAINLFIYFLCQERPINYGLFFAFCNPQYFHKSKKKILTRVSRGLKMKGTDDFSEQ